MRRRLPTLATLAAAAVVLAVAAVGTRAESTAHGWLADGYTRLVESAFWRHLDRAAPSGLGALALGAVAALLAGWRPPRREVMPALVVVAFLATIRLVGWGRAQLGPHGPNVLLISIDTLRADRLGAYGYQKPTSPTLDRRLAAEGVVFERTWSHSPKTTPSHMTMLTSLYESVHGVGLWDRGRAPVLNPRVHTLAEVLKNEGYVTAAFTAGAHMHRERGFVQGFDVYKHGEQLRRALEFLDARGPRPFFLFFHTYQVHDPYVPPLDTMRTFAADPVPKILHAVSLVRDGVGGWEKAHRIFWESVDPTSPRDVRFVSDLYDAGIRRMDDTTLTALLDRLDALDLAKETLVVFTSDHGEAFQEHGRFLHDDLWAGTLHVPLVLRLPGRLPAGRRIRTPVRLVDLMPTILGLLGVRVPRQAQGTSLVPLALGADGLVAPEFADVLAPGVAIAEYPHTPGRVFESVRSGPFTLVVDGTEARLFDHNADPGEEHDIASAKPARTKILLAHLRRWHAECARRAPVLGPRGADAAGPDEETIRQLRALGYVD